MPHTKAAAADHLRTWRYGIAAFAIVAAAAAIELRMGRVPWCRCGYIKLWHGIVQSAENSQQLTDWYTPSHVIHGIAFYLLLWLFAARLPIGARFLLAVVLESSWEVIENTPMMIDHYRTATISLDYYGDSVINSMCDVVAMMGGFWLARRIPVWGSIAVVLVLEILVGVIIRDNLTLNILMLVYPLEVIKRWQLGG